MSYRDSEKTREGQVGRNFSPQDSDDEKRIEVDVIIPVHNAGKTICEAVESALSQEIPENLREVLSRYRIDLAVCCYDDGSTDESWSLLHDLQEKDKKKDKGNPAISSVLLIKASDDGVARGAGYARNRAVNIRDEKRFSSSTRADHKFLCLLDSDDTMHPARVAEQLHCMLALQRDERERMLIGCQFDRDPPDSTWHYARWANGLTDERLMLERFREITVLQPTWMLCRSRWSSLGGEIEAPHPDGKESTADVISKDKTSSLCLIHPDYDTQQTLRLAEDLRFFHAHLASNGMLRLHRTKTPLVTYRHSGTSQSFQTSRKLLLHLRVLALETNILRSDPLWQHHDGRFVVWGAGRDGKDFVKALSQDMRRRVYCFVDVDEKKIDHGYYVNREIDVRIPIVHFSMLASDPGTRRQLKQNWEEGLENNEIEGRIDKGKGPSADDAVATEATKTTPVPRRKKRKTHALNLSDLDTSMLSTLPVVVCVAMYRTNGALEKNVMSIGRTEGVDLWHFS
jgi:hypothetical protein